MRKIIVSNLVSLDGFMAGPKGEIDWFLWNEETAQYAKELAKSIDTILFGRVTYELMANFWPTPAADSEDQVITKYMNESAKIVFSKTLEKADWKNTRVIKDINPEEILKLKQQSGKDMVIYGSGGLVSSLTQMGLIDDYLIFINPVVLGQGIPLFRNLNDRYKLKLINTKSFNNGVVLLHYEVLTM